MSPRSGHLQGPPRLRLPHHVGQIGNIPNVYRLGRIRAAQLRLPTQPADDVDQAGGAEHLDPLDERRLRHRTDGNDSTPVTDAACRQEGRQHPGNTTETTVQRQFPE